MADLIDRLVAASAAAIRDQRPALLHNSEEVRGLTLELTIGTDGQVRDAISFIERRAHGPALLARPQAARS